MALVPFEELRFDWSKSSDRKKFEASKDEQKATKSKKNGILWKIGMILPQFLIVLALYGPIAYIITM